MNPPSSPTTISADGKCLANRPENLDTLELVIDGNQLVGQPDASTLSGTFGEFLPESIHYRLTSFEPQQDGTCVARYVRVDTDEN